MDKDDSDDADGSFSMQDNKDDSSQCSSLDESDSASCCSFHSCTESVADVTHGAHTLDASQVFAEAALNLQTEELA